MKVQIKKRVISASSRDKIIEDFLEEVPFETSRRKISKNQDGIEQLYILTQGYKGIHTSKCMKMRNKNTLNKQTIFQCVQAGRFF